MASDHLLCDQLDYCCYRQYVACHCPCDVSISHRPTNGGSDEYVCADVHEHRRYAALFERAARQAQASPTLISLTLFGSVIGAFLLLLIPTRSVPIVVSVAVMAVAVFALVYRKSGVARSTIQPSAKAELAGYVLTFLLGIYGWFFSGGYITILTAVYVAFFRLSFVEAIATTKLINVFSSAVATDVFMWHGLVDYRLGLILGVTMFVGGLVGARLAIKLGNEWLKRIFLTAVWLLGLKFLFLDVLGSRAGCNASTPASE